MSERRAFRLIHFSRTSHRYQSRAPAQAVLRMRIRELAEVRVSYGYRRIHVLLLREGWKVNHKRVYRLYRLEGLTMRTKKPRRRHVSGKNRIERPVATTRNETWSMDFMSDELFNGDRIRLFTLVDHFTRESPAIEVVRSIPATRVVEVLDRFVSDRVAIEEFVGQEIHRPGLVPGGSHRSLGPVSARCMMTPGLLVRFVSPSCL